MRRRMAALAAAVLWGAAALLVLSPPGARAEAPAATAWWWRTQTGLLGAAVPPPPGVDADDLMVAGAPDGATAVSALRWELAPGEGQPSLSLVAKDEANGDSARLAACATASAWSPTQAGRWDDKPVAACDVGSVQGIRIEGGDGTVLWSFALEPLLRPDGVLDVVLVAGTLDGQPQGPANGATFQLVFEAPGPGALVTRSGAIPGGAPVPEPSPAPSSPPAAFVPALPAAAPAVVGPAVPLPAAPAPTSPAPARRPAPAARPLDPVSADDERGDRLLAAVVLTLAAAAVSVIAWPQLAQAIGVTRLGLVPAPIAPGDPEVRGLGRFARPRAGPPPPL